MFCKNCGAEINDNAIICIKCGCAIKNSQTAFTTESGEKNWVVAYLLSWFLGAFGAHRFYLAKYGTGITMLLTLGGCGIWAMVDFICLSFNRFKDADNEPLVGYIKVLGMIGFGFLLAGILFYGLYFLICFMMGFSEAMGE